MTPQQRKRKSTEIEDNNPSSSNAAIIHEDTSVAETPTGTPARKKLRITQRQKQALIDNLQLEITERARKLRAQYALQAQDLRARIERRVHRIPAPLRKCVIGDLLAKHEAISKATSPVKTSPVKAAPRPLSAMARMTSPSKKKTAGCPSSSPNVARPGKRASDIYADKENAGSRGGSPLAVPKKRGMPVRGLTTSALSPKSSNSRTYPQSPLKASPIKSNTTAYNTQPASPTKQASPLKKSTTAETTRARGARAATTASATRTTATTKRPATAMGPPRTTSRTGTATLARPATAAARHIRTASNSSEASSTMSTGTTVVKKAAAGTVKKAGAATKGRARAATTSSALTAKAGAKAATTAAAAKKGATVKKDTAVAATTAAGGKRTLRKRA